jgi:hypothetical protein
MQVTHIIVSYLVTNQIDLDFVDKMIFDETTKVLQPFNKPCRGLQRLILDQILNIYQLIKSNQMITYDYI